MMGELEPEGESVSVDTSVPHIARVYDYWLGGKDNISQVVSRCPHSAVTVPIQ